jgi:hypothetical protein
LRLVVVVVVVVVRRTSTFSFFWPSSFCEQARGSRR